MAEITTGSSLFYLGLSIIVLVNCILAEKYKQKIFPTLIVIILSFVAGFRAYTVGSDTLVYVQFFNYPESINTSVKSPFFTIVCKILMFIIPNPTFLFLVFAVIIYGLITFRLWELHDRISFTYSFMTFYCLYFFETMNGLRQFLAAAIMFWGSKYILQKKYAKFITCVLIATAFHSTAIIGLVYISSELFEWKNLSKRKKRFFLSLIAVGILASLYLMQTGYIENKLSLYTHYLGESSTSRGLRMLTLVAIFVTSLFLYKPGNVGESTCESESELRSIRLYYAIGCGIGIAFQATKFVVRLNWHYALFFGMYFGFLAKERRQLSRLILKAMMLFVLIYTIINYIWFLNGSFHHPYHFVWDQ